MPQFDISSFVVQLLSLFLIFLSFYFIFSWKYLTYWACLLKTRYKFNAISTLKNLNRNKFVIYKKNA